MLSAIIPILMIVIGVLMYALASPQNQKVAKIGEWMFAAGFFAVAFAYAGKMVTLLRG